MRFFGAFLIAVTVALLLVVTRLRPELPRAPDAGTIGPIGMSKDETVSAAAGSFSIRQGHVEPVATISAQGTTTRPELPALAPGRYAFCSDGLWYWIDIPGPW